MISDNSFYLQILRHNLIPNPRSLVVEYPSASISEAAVAALHQIFVYDRKITAHRVPATMSPTLFTNKQQNSGKDEESDTKQEQPEATTAFTTDAASPSTALEGDASGAASNRGTTQRKNPI